MAWITTPERTTYDWHEVPSDEVPSDREMKAVLVSRLNENLYTQDSDIRVDVSERVVVLDGDVDSPIVRRIAADDAWDVPGVMEVDNRLSVAS
jgi:osmotically-inducible protein OsmY